MTDDEGCRQPSGGLQYSAPTFFSSTLPSFASGMKIM